MSHQRILSSRFNMSLGFIPVIISIILCEFITQDMSIYIGAGVGLLFSIYSVRHRGTHVPQIILYCTTGMLLLLSVTTLFLVNYCPRFMLPFTLEISAIIPRSSSTSIGEGFWTTTCLRHRNAASNFCTRGRSRHRIRTRNPYHKPAAFSDYLLGGSGQLPFGRHYPPHSVYVAPPLVFISGILFNQFGIFYFNIVMNHTVFVPIVNTKGDVMGKAIASEAINRKTTISIRSSGLPLPHTACCFSSLAPNATFSRKIKSTC